VRGWGMIEPRVFAGLDPGWGWPPEWHDALAVLLTPALALAVLGLVAERRRRLAWVLGGACVVWQIYLARVGADWMPGWRFFVPITPAVVLLMVAGCNRLAGLARRLRGVGRVLVAGGVAGTVAGLVLLSLGEVFNYQAPVVQGHAFIQAHYRTAGEYLRAHAPPGASLAVIDAGAIPYYSGLVTIDYGGLADKHMGQVPFRPMWLDKGDGILRYYPVLRYDTDYLLSRRPDFVQLSGLMLPDGRHVEHLPDLALIYQALLKDGSYDTTHPVLYDEPIQLILVKRYDTAWTP
jgi:hypothetical protein